MERYLNKDLSIRERVDDLIGKMTLREKMGQLNQKLYGWQCYEKSTYGFKFTETFKKHVEWGQGLGALYGVFRADPWSKINKDNGIPSEKSFHISNKIQRYVLENSRLKIPVLLTEECPHGHQAIDSISYPTAIGRGASWNRELIEKTSRNIAQEIAAKGVNMALISTLDLARDPRWGRCEECFSEDPYLAGELTEATTYGLQGRGLSEIENLLDKTVESLQKDSTGIAVVLKHFAAQGDAIGGHNSGPVNIGEREFREIALPPMIKGARAGALGVMAAYNEIDGIPCHGNEKLLTDILRGELKFKGLVMADGCAIDRLLLMTASKEKAANLALTSGVDLSLWDDIYTHIEEAVNNRILDIEIVDRAVARVLTVKFVLGIFDKPFIHAPKDIESKRIQWKKDNLQLATESITLLKNKNNLLPLSKNIKNIAVIGPNADEIYNQLGDYTSPRNKEDGTTVYQGVKKILGEDINISYCKGCEIRDNSYNEIDKAIDIAKGCEAIILCLGGSSKRNFDMEFLSNGAVSSIDINMDSGENVDVADLKLGGLQLELARRIIALGIPVVTVLIQGRAHEITELYNMSNSILCAFYPGEEGGEAIAKIIFGEENPSGRLPVSFPRSSGQLPVYYNQKNAGGKIHYYDEKGSPLLPFGFGLSYTEFKYEKIYIKNKGISLKELQEGKKVKLDIYVENIGRYHGKEVVQLYIYDEEATITRRRKELKGFKKVYIKSGETKIVTLSLGIEELSIWNPKMDFVAEQGNIKIMVGGLEERILIT